MKKIKKTLVFILVMITLTSCSSVSHKYKSGNCIENLNQHGVFGKSYTGDLTTIINPDSNDEIKQQQRYLVDSTTKVAYLDTNDNDTISYYLPNGSSINIPNIEELEYLKPLFKKLGIKKPKWFLVESSPILSTLNNDPIFSNYTNIFKNSKPIKTNSGAIVYKSWDKTSYKIIEIKCKNNLPSEVRTEYGSINGNKNKKMVLSKYVISYNRPKIIMPSEDVLNYTKMINTVEGKFFIGKPIADEAFSFVLNFVNIIKPKNMLSENDFSAYIDYIVNSVNNDPEMNGIVLEASGNIISGKLKLDGLTYYYEIIIDRNSGSPSIKFRNKVVDSKNESIKKV